MASPCSPVEAYRRYAHHHWGAFPALWLTDEAEWYRRQEVVGALWVALSVAECRQEERLATTPLEGWTEQELDEYALLCATSSPWEGDHE